MDKVPPELQPIVADSSAAVSAAIARAYELGREHGRAEAAKEVKDRLSSVLDLVPDTAPKHAPSEPEPKAAHGPRAPKGTVRPAIVDVLRPARAPMSPAQILSALHRAGHTLVKAETIRSTLHKMAADGSGVRKHGDGWIFVNPTGYVNEIGPTL